MNQPVPTYILSVLDRMRRAQICRQGYARIRLSATLTRSSFPITASSMSVSPKLAVATSGNGANGNHGFADRFSSGAAASRRPVVGERRPLDNGSDGRLVPDLLESGIRL